MVCLEVEPEVAGWKAQTNPLSYDGTPSLIVFNVDFKLVCIGPQR